MKHVNTAPGPAPAPRGPQTVPMPAAPTTLMPGAPTAPMPGPATAPMAAPPIAAPAPAPAPAPHGPSTASSLPLKAPAEAAPFAQAPDDDQFRIERPLADFARISLRRALTKRIDPALVLPAERAAMTLASPPIVDRNFQAFLAWRRSVLFAVALLLVPLVILRAIEVLGASGTPPAVRALLTVPVIVEAAFCGLCFWLLRDWVSWYRQRRRLALGFVVAFVAPFLVYLVPVRAVVSGDDVGVGLMFSVQAILVLAPRAIATMPGVIRGSMVTKLLLPATAAPGWLMVMAAPLYALLAYLALVQPYQLTGSGFFVATILALGGAAIVVGRAGWQLARAQPHAEAAAIVARSRNANLIAMGLAGAFALLALAALQTELHLGALTVVTTVASFAVHVLAVTLVTTDGVLAALDRARGRRDGSFDADHDRQLASFVGAAADAQAPTRNP